MPEPTVASEPVTEPTRPAGWPIWLGLLVLFVVGGTLGFAPFGQFWLTFLAAGALTLAARRCRTPLRAFVAGYIAGACFFGANLWYIWFITAPGSIGLPVYLAVYVGLYAALVRGLFGEYGQLDSPGRVAGMVVFAALVWAGLEWVRGTLFTGLPYIYLGHTQTPLLWMIQIADITGAYGVSAWVVAVGATLAAAWEARQLRRWLPTAAGVVGLTALIAGYGLFRISTAELREGPTVLVLQPVFPQDNTGAKGATEIEMLAWHVEHTQTALDELHEQGVTVDLVAWSETILPPLNVEARRFYVPYVRGQTIAAADEYLRSASTAGPAYLVGSNFEAMFEDRTDPDGTRYVVPTDRRNVAYFYEDGRQLPLRQDKMHLVPYGEYMPFREWPVPIRWLYDVFQVFNPYGEDYALTPGTRHEVFTVGHSTEGAAATFAVPICFEDLVAPHVRRLVMDEDGTKKVGFLVNLTNDGWFRGNQMAQHLQAARFRSIELRVATARAVNNGISGFVDPLGRLDGLVPASTEGYSAQPVLLDERVTIYARVGDAFAIGSLMATFVWTIAAGWRRRTPRRDNV